MLQRQKRILKQILAGFERGADEPDQRQQTDERRDREECGSQVQEA
jgi:hypothetical protein